MRRPAVRNLSAERWGIIGLAALAIATVLLAATALIHYRTPVVATVESPTAPTSGPTSPTIDVPIAPTTPATPTKSPTSTPTKSPTPALKGLALVASLIEAPDSSVMVFGDGSGNDVDEWVSVWAKDHLAAKRTASYRTWNRSTAAFNKAKRFGQGGDAISVWNASMASPNMSTEPERVAQAWQPSEVVMLNYGHRISASQIKGQLNDILDEIRAHDPSVAVLVLIQNPDPVASESVQRQTTLAVQRWAESKGLPTVNVYDAFIAHPAPRSQLVESDGAPTPLGSALFAHTLADALAKG